MQCNLLKKKNRFVVEDVRSRTRGACSRCQSRLRRTGSVGKAWLRQGTHPPLSRSMWERGKMRHQRKNDEESCSAGNFRQISGGTVHTASSISLSRLQFLCIIDALQASNLSIPAANGTDSLCLRPFICERNGEETACCLLYSTPKTRLPSSRGPNRRTKTKDQGPRLRLRRHAQAACRMPR